MGTTQIVVHVGAEPDDAIRRLASTPGLQVEPGRGPTYRVTKCRRPRWVARTRTCVIALNGDETATLSGDLAPTVAELLKQAIAAPPPPAAADSRLTAGADEQLPVALDGQPPAPADEQPPVVADGQPPVVADKQLPTPADKRLSVPAGEQLPVVTFDDGRRLTLDRALLLGRDPAAEPGTLAVRIDDPDRSVSKTHCAAGIQADGTAWVADRYSANGTCIIDIAGTVYACPPGVAVEIPPGATVHFGERSFTVAAGR
ncbi:hypothetical protein [Actinoplanes sp. NPDC049265]|uniref:hypothetical protein n=1 Tax=Actinoplanes sp. NPDC049265 TaxID=3363902 RepID=UPI003723291E